MEEEEKFLIGVYDHLRRDGEANDMYLHDAKYIGTYYTDPDFDLYALSPAYPGLRKGGSTSVLLEIFEVTEDDIKIADYYEGFSEFAPSQSIFDRIEIDTPFGPCYVYEYSKIISGKPLIESGDWFQHKASIKKEISDINESQNWGMD
jgi:gamma-glutamylcyclotransferase (GGCT)/AIG2-like uncharacterized protein YtfP